MYCHTKLGAISPADAADAVMPESAVSSVPGFTSAVYNDILNSATSGQIEGFTQSCPGVPGNTAKIVTTAAGLGVSIAGAAATAAGVASAVLAPLTMGATAIIGIFAAIFAHHAQAVAKEQQVECAAVPAFNAGIEAISQAVSEGTITPTQGIGSLTQLLNDFEQQISSIMKNDASQCNAGCVWYKCAQAAVAEMQSQFQDLVTSEAATSSTATGTSSATPTTTASGLPSWLPLAAIAALGLLAAMELA